MPFEFVPLDLTYPKSNILQPFELFSVRTYTPAENAFIIDTYPPGPFSNGYLTGFGLEATGMAAGYTNISFACFINGVAQYNYMFGFSGLSPGPIANPTSIVPIQVKATDHIQVSITNGDTNPIKAFARFIGFYDLAGDKARRPGRDY